MEWIKVSEAKYLDGYRVYLKFSDGFSGVVDLKEEIYGEVFEPLKSVNYFKSFTQDRWTIGWACGADFAPEFLYDLAKKQEEERTALSEK